MSARAVAAPQPRLKATGEVHSFGEKPHDIAVMLRDSYGSSPSEAATIMIADRGMRIVLVAHGIHTVYGLSEREAAHMYLRLERGSARPSEVAQILKEVYGQTNAQAVAELLYADEKVDVVETAVAISTVFKVGPKDAVKVFQQMSTAPTEAVMGRMLKNAYQVKEVECAELLLAVMGADVTAVGGVIRDLYGLGAAAVGKCIMSVSAPATPTEVSVMFKAAFDINDALVAAKILFSELQVSITEVARALKEAFSTSPRETARLVHSLPSPITAGVLAMLLKEVYGLTAHEAAEVIYTHEVYGIVETGAAVKDSHHADALQTAQIFDELWLPSDDASFFETVWAYVTDKRVRRSTDKYSDMGYMLRSAFACDSVKAAEILHDSKIACDISNIGLMLREVYEAGASEAARVIQKAAPTTTAHEMCIMLKNIFSTDLHRAVRILHLERDFGLVEIGTAVKDGYGVNSSVAAAAVQALNVSPSATTPPPAARYVPRPPSPRARQASPPSASASPSRRWESPTTGRPL